MLLAPTVTALQTLLEVCRAYAGPHDIVYNTTKTVCMVVRPNQSQGQFSTRVRLGNEELSFVEEFKTKLCLCRGHIMTEDCRDDKDIKQQFRRQNAVGNMLVRKFSFAPPYQKFMYGAALAISGKHRLYLVIFGMPLEPEYFQLLIVEFR